MIRNLRERAIEQALKPFISLLGRASDKDIERLSFVAEKLAFALRSPRPPR